MSSTSTFEWPKDSAEAVKLAREMFLKEHVGNARYWIKWAMDYIMYRAPETPYERPASAVAQEDAAFRDAFAGFSIQQQDKLLELLNRCISGAVFSALTALDQFPHGEASVCVRESHEKDLAREFIISPADSELHEDFYNYYQDVTPDDVRKPTA